MINALEVLHLRLQLLGKQLQHGSSVLGNARRERTRVKTLAENTQVSSAFAPKHATEKMAIRYHIYRQSNKHLDALDIASLSF